MVIGKLPGEQQRLEEKDRTFPALHRPIHHQPGEAGRQREFLFPGGLPVGRQPAECAIYFLLK